MQAEDREQEAVLLREEAQQNASDPIKLKQISQAWSMRMTEADQWYKKARQLHILVNKLEHTSQMHDMGVEMKKLIYTLERVDLRTPELLQSTLDKADQMLDNLAQVPESETHKPEDLMREVEDFSSLDILQDLPPISRSRAWVGTEQDLGERLKNLTGTSV